MHVDDLPQLVVGGDRQVPLLDGRWQRYINLDNAASTPALRPVLRGINHFMEWYCSVHRGSGFKSQVSTWAYEKSRELVTDFLGGDVNERVVIYGKNTTEAVNKLARRYPFRDGDILLTTDMEHHSNDLPWRSRVRIERLLCDETGAVHMQAFADALKNHRGCVRLVAVTGASNVTGILNPIADIARLAHAAGAEIFVDAAQLAAHRQIRIGKRGQDDCIDYLALSAHKMYAPFGTGALIGWKEVFNDGAPDMVGGGTVWLVTPDDVIWRESPDRDEAGSPNVVGAVALALAAHFLLRLGMPALVEHESKLTAHMLAGMREIPGIRIYGPLSADPNARLGVIAFNIQDEPHGRVAAVLACEAGVAVRNGCFCAHPYIKKLLGITAPEMRDLEDRVRRGDYANLPGAVRISFGGYNTMAEVDHTLAALRQIASHSYAGEYVADERYGEYWPKNYHPDYSDFFSFA